MTVPRTGSDSASRIHVPVWLLGLIFFSGTFAMHIFVPAMPMAAADLGVGSSTMQMTVSLYIIGLAVGQLIYGPISDRFGRRPTLMVGLSLYTVAGFAAALAPNIQVLITARIFQALGGCAGLALSRAIVRDTSDMTQSAQRLSILNLMVMIGPGLAPVLGGVVAAAFGWRPTLFVLCALGIANFTLCWRLLPETAAPYAGRSAMQLVRNYLQLLKSPAFLGFSIGGGCSTTSFYAFVAAAPFIYTQQLHRPIYEVGFYIAIIVAGAWVGSAIAARLVTRVPRMRLLNRANGGSIIAAIVQLAFVATGHNSVPLEAVTMFFFALGCGVASPVAQAAAISVDPRAIGSASGLYGSTQMAVGAISAALAGIGSNPALTTSLVLVIMALIAFGSLRIAERQPTNQNMA